MGLSSGSAYFVLLLSQGRETRDFGRGSLVSTVRLSHHEFHYVTHEIGSLCEGAPSAAQGPHSNDVISNTSNSQHLFQPISTAHGGIFQEADNVLLLADLCSSCSGEKERVAYALKLLSSNLGPWPEK